MKLPVASRSCGNCTECCTAIGVKELGKPYFQACRRLCESGCSRYRERPDSCRRYECGYLADYPIRRPDESGLIYEVRKTVPAGYRLDIFETRPGAYELGKEEIQSFVAKHAILSVCVYRHRSRVLLDFPPGPAYEDRGEYGVKYPKQDAKEWYGRVPVIVIDGSETLVPA